MIIRLIIQIHNVKNFKLDVLQKVEDVLIKLQSVQIIKELKWSAVNLRDLMELNLVGIFLLLHH